jgi:F0F1-type ATP synthase membrane subunit c/vacuolar-type H+-ATPase subunit K
MTAPIGRPELTPDQALRVTRIIGLALAAGVTLFALVTWGLQRENATSGTGDASLFFTVWVAFAAASAVGATLFWRIRVAPILEGSPPAPGPARRIEALQTGLIICWALIEGAALFGVVVYLLFGNATAGAGAVALMWIALALTWPKREWFGVS